MQVPKLSGDRVESRWWYWVAAVPTVFVFWLVTVAWVAFAMRVDPGLLSAPRNPLVHAAVVSLVAVGVPFVVLTVLLPLAVLQDARAINRAEVGWEPSDGYAAAALVGLVALVGLGVFDPSAGIIAGFLAAVPVAAYYLRERHRHVGVP